MTTTSASLARPELPAIDLRGVRLHAITERECIAHVLGELRAGRGGHVVTPNLDHLVRSRRDPAFRELIQRADLSVADGMPLVWASRLQGTPLPERVAGSDLISTLSRPPRQRVARCSCWAATPALRKAPPRSSAVVRRS